MLEGLGVRPSDLCLAAGLVWVEGPSDRTYLNRWLSLWCKDNHCIHEPFEENIHYAYAMYGGALLSTTPALPRTMLSRCFVLIPTRSC